MHVRTFPEICSRMCATKHYVKNKIMKQCHLHVHILDFTFLALESWWINARHCEKARLALFFGSARYFDFLNGKTDLKVFFFNVRARLLKFRLPFIELTNQGFKTFSASCKKLRLGLCDSFVGKWRLCNY